MKINSRMFYVAMVAALLGAVIIAWRPQPVSASASTPMPPGACDTTRSVDVSGAAVVYVTPDRAMIQLGVQSNGATPDATHEENFRTIQQVISAVRALGVDARDIATDSYLVYPVYQDYDALTIKGYRVDNLVTVTLRDISLADDTLLVALKAGANEVQDVQFYTSELRSYRDQARALAVQAASEKAAALAGAGGAQSACVLNISENTWTQYYGSWRGGRETAIWAQNVTQNAGNSVPTATQSDDSPISLGQIAVRAEVTVKYSLK